jgi:hypothetical protein
VHCRYRDIAPLLQQLAKRLGKKPADLSIYDPYYCVRYMYLCGREGVGGGAIEGRGVLFGFLCGCAGGGGERERERAREREREKEGRYL